MTVMGARMRSRATVALGDHDEMFGQIRIDADSRQVARLPRLGSASGPQGDLAPSGREDIRVLHWIRTAFRFASLQDYD